MRALIEKLQLSRDHLRRRVGVWLFDKKKTTQAIVPRAVKHIVFLRTDAKLGDAFVSSFVFNDIKRYNPDIKTTVAAAPNMATLFTEHLGADHVVTLKKRPKYRDIARACKQIGKCDLVVSLNLNLKMKDLYFLSQCQSQHIAGLDDSLQLIDIKLGEKTKAMHFSERFAAVLEHIGIEASPKRYVIPQTDTSRKTAQHFIDQHQLNAYCVVNGYGSGNARKLTGESLATLTRLIKQSAPNLPIVLLSSPETQVQTEGYLQQFDIDAIHYDVSTSIFDVASLLETATFVVSVDTAIVHMASGLDRPQLTIYPPDDANFDQWHPNSDKALVCYSEVNTVPDVNRIDWAIVEQKLKQLVSSIKASE
ncbi:glycosyltransferase family 9 protein [Vibrio sp. 10N.222.51.C12]|uniref:glycosyltransferase family 9 protein n=1 Tax=Vibrio sp. 10N.222.51.C12 TaxID=3229622 RepID=UPI003553DC5C